MPRLSTVAAATALVATAASADVRAANQLAADAQPAPWHWPWESHHENDRMDIADFYSQCSSVASSVPPLTEDKLQQLARWLGLEDGQEYIDSIYAFLGLPKGSTLTLQQFCDWVKDKHCPTHAPPAPRTAAPHPYTTPRPPSPYTSAPYAPRPPSPTSAPYAPHTSAPYAPHPHTSSPRGHHTNEPAVPRPWTPSPNSPAAPGGNNGHENEDGAGDKSADNSFSIAGNGKYLLAAVGAIVLAVAAVLLACCCCKVCCFAAGKKDVEAEPVKEQPKKLEDEDDFVPVVGEPLQQVPTPYEAQVHQQIRPDVVMVESVEDGIAQKAPY